MKLFKHPLFYTVLVSSFALAGAQAWALPAAHIAKTLPAMLLQGAPPDEANVHIHLTGTVSQSGDQFILTTEDGNTYVLDPPRSLADLVGRTVSVSGMLDVDEAVIVVQHISPAED